MGNNFPSPPGRHPVPPTQFPRQQSASKGHENTSSVVEGGSKIDQPVHSGFQEIQQQVDELQASNKEDSIYKKSFNKGIDVAITVTETVTTGSMMLDQGVAAATKMLEGSQTQDIISNIEKNPALNHLIQLADKLVDIGKSVPFIAPAFIILKIIIDIEQKARDADAKCEDLLERINFMVSNITVLEKVEAIDPLKVVIEKTISTLKSAASLIQAYRKQGSIARRLNMSNSQNFVQMAQKIMACSQDLMLSLQIQQTGDLSVLSRSVPVDNQDKEAEIFVSTHGGQSVINCNPELVEKFAEKMQLTMSDQVMDQMQLNVGDILEENQSRIETLLKENSSNAIADTIKALAAEVREREAEQRLPCLQCGKEYREAANGAGACSFHKSPEIKGTFTCCGQKSPCAFSNHRSVHHCEYPYTSFFDYAYGILGYGNNINKWAEVLETDMVTNIDQYASVGKLIRWSDLHEKISQPLMVIRIGSIKFGSSYFFQVLDVDAIKSVNAIVRQTGKTLIFRTVQDESEYSMGEWTLDDAGVINGVVLSSKVATSDTATVKTVPIDIETLSLSGEVQTLSQSRFRVYKPAEPYTFPGIRHVGHIARDTPLREQREFKARTKLPLIVIPQGKMQANPSPFMHGEDDQFQGTLRIFNKALPSSETYVTLVSCTAHYRLVGDKEYKDVRSLSLGNTKFPVSIAPTQSVDFSFETYILRNAAQAALESMCRDFAMIALHHPVRIRLTFKDIEDQEFVFVQEYVHDPRDYLEAKASNDILFLQIYDVFSAHRSVMRIKKGDERSDTIINIGEDRKLSVEDLNLIVYEAEQTGVTEVHVRDRDAGLFKWDAWALVDLSCRRVYGFKVLLMQGSSRSKKTTAALGYAPCPIYGEGNLEERPIRYADERSLFPELEPEEVLNVVSDDDVDDDKVVVTAQAADPIIAIATAASSSVTAAISEVSKATNSLDAAVFSSGVATLEKKLESLGADVTRMATALEKLVDLLSH
ncbi:hypothetical protein BGZ91_008050 [Linnemannia elongata]|nr:hypothetical protein BGZ91_008050 [Linnemannia elongata]KAG0079416.1 hypothetical protein BGZ90_002676 [Linnemannia elongata]